MNINWISSVYHTTVELLDKHLYKHLPMCLDDIWNNLSSSEQNLRGHREHLYNFPTKPNKQNVTPQNISNILRMFLVTKISDLGINTKFKAGREI